MLLCNSSVQQEEHYDEYTSNYPAIVPEAEANFSLVWRMEKHITRLSNDLRLMTISVSPFPHSTKYDLAEVQ